ncbi:hypothetical protein QYF61_018750, partial [Mycteria americana]
MKGTEHLPYKDRLNTQGLFCLEKTQLSDILQISVIMLWRRPTAIHSSSLIGTSNPIAPHAASPLLSSPSVALDFGSAVDSTALGLAAVPRDKLLPPSCLPLPRNSHASLQAANAARLPCRVLLQCKEPQYNRCSTTLHMLDTANSDVLRTEYNVVKWERLAGPHMRVSYARGYVFQMVKESNPTSSKKGTDPQMSMLGNLSLKRVGGSVLSARGKGVKRPQPLQHPTACGERQRSPRASPQGRLRAGAVLHRPTSAAHTSGVTRSSCQFSHALTGRVKCTVSYLGFVNYLSPAHISLVSSSLEKRRIWAESDSLDPMSGSKVSLESMQQPLSSAAKQKPVINSLGQTGAILLSRRLLQALPSLSAGTTKHDRSGEAEGGRLGEFTGTVLRKKNGWGQDRGLQGRINSSLDSITRIDRDKTQLFKLQELVSHLTHVHRAHRHGRWLARDLHQPGLEIGGQ